MPLPLASLIGPHLSHPCVARQQALVRAMCVLTRCCGDVENREVLVDESEADEGTEHGQNGEMGSAAHGALWHRQHDLPDWQRLQLSTLIGGAEV